MKRFRILIQDHLNSFRTILIGFILLILAGALLLKLPFASKDGQSVPFINALFTSASAACVTGLVVYDTATQWTLFGRAVILILIQIGGLGVVTAFIMTMLLTGKQIGLIQRIAIQDSISAPQIGGIVRFASFFIKGTFLIEGTGAVLLLPSFAKEFGFFRGLGHALFHSISAFCNAGFDLMGSKAPFSSLVSFQSSIPVNTVICLLILIGGAGFLTWSDLLTNRFRLKGLRLQTKLILSSAAILLIVPFLYFFFLEFAGMPMKERILLSAFQSVTPRTAGFATMDYGKMSEPGLLLTIVLMMIGGAPGSTAGGMKLTTAAVIVLSALSSLRMKSDTNAFKRRIEPNIISNAYTLFFIYLSLFLISGTVISAMEQIPVISGLFECASAIGTVGLTVGITPQLCSVSKGILIFLMYLGRVGSLTLAYALVSANRKDNSRLPAEKLTVG